MGASLTVKNLILLIVLIAVGVSLGIAIAHLFRTEGGNPKDNCPRNKVRVKVICAPKR